jgi:hypothetical protein
MREDAPDFSLVTVYIKNETVDVWYVFISPADSNMWGADFLDETTMLEVDKSTDEGVFAIDINDLD